MTTFTIEAIYRDGVLIPATDLNLPDNTPVEVQVTTQSPLADQRSLFGAFPELGVLSDADLDWAAEIWNSSSDRRATGLSKPE